MSVYIEKAGANATHGYKFFIYTRYKCRNSCGCSSIPCSSNTHYVTNKLTNAKSGLKTEKKKKKKKEIDNTKWFHAGARTTLKIYFNSTNLNEWCARTHADFFRKKSLVLCACFRL